jgi:UTP--glucose-1-phosphate uridylyltransferase
MVEKPKPSEAPSRLAIAGRYVLTPEIFAYIDRTPPGIGNEVQLTDALRLMSKDREIYAHKFQGKRYDIGNRLDYMRTLVELGVKRGDIGPDFRAFLKEFAAGLTD